jgi:hypothetical protein
MARRRDLTSQPLKRLPGPEDLLHFLTWLSLGGMPPADTGLKDRCWNWMGSTVPKGYGKLRYDGRLELAHRFSYQGFKRRKARRGQHHHHLCRNILCCNPGHISEKSPAYNTAEGNRHRRHDDGADIPF